MPDIDPSALIAPSRISTTPILPPKTISASAPVAPKVSKSNHVPPRIDLEPLYTALKSAIGEHWGTYKESISLFVMGQLNQKELSERIDGFLITPTGEIEHLHNQLVSAIYANVTREMPDHGVASWVSANDKPTTGAGSKPVSGDAAEQRLKTEVMQLPSRDRRRLKDLSQNDFDPRQEMANIFGEQHRAKPIRPVDAVPASAGGLNKTNWDLEIRKRYAQPLASESGEFPDTSTIESRMLPICYETGLVSGHAPDAAHFMSVATETFIKEVLSSVFSKTRSNGPGASGSAGTGGGSSWIQTHKYRTQLEREEEISLRGEIQRDKSGLLPIEAKAASERGPLGMADFRTALELGDCGLGQMPVVVQQIMMGYREGEVESWDDYSWPETYPKIFDQDIDGDIEMGGMHVANGINGVNGHFDVEGDDYGWEGGEMDDKTSLDSLLDSCLAIGS
ncbi:transcriptional regulator of RNA polII, SAGA, subunit-domain-containing protein [Leptodontidium sp. 2 PMI_412]|nr:transcriptional regulator of RNA polII, SAGA, subunit-domain-containing protein [Leptodontidium sp. MPI-SDFR-AT-0119]KAH9223419.1 transcriptional regulator of RNA polII, SAGA, subunit-domain-containing protein [Leptodontidium sp. 2 PMI_412]